MVNLVTDGKVLETSYAPILDGGKCVRAKLLEVVTDRAFRADKPLLRREPQCPEAGHAATVIIQGVRSADSNAGRR